MKDRVCICCGEIMHHQGEALSRNPNMCASCSSLTDGMENGDASPVPSALKACPEVVPAGGSPAAAPAADTILSRAA